MLTNWFAFLLHKFLKVSTPSNTCTVFVCVCFYTYTYKSVYIINNVSKLKVWLQVIRYLQYVDCRCFQSIDFLCLCCDVLSCVNLWVCPSVCVLAGVCWRASVHAVLRHQAADGKGAHWRHHRRGPLLPEWRQAHPPADRVQNPGTSHSMRHTRSLHRRLQTYTNTRVVQ